MTVDEMLARTPSYRLTEWLAYEQLYGPIGRQYEANQLASIEERLAYLTEVTAKRGTKSQPKTPERIPRPWELYEDPKHVKRPERKPYWEPDEEEEGEE